MEYYRVFTNMPYWTALFLLVFLFGFGSSSFHIERLVDTKASWQRKSPPYYSLDMFANPGGCSFLSRASCRKLGASCQGLFSCCYCECPMWHTFVSLPSKGCKSGDEFREAMKNLGVNCQFLSVQMNYGIPSFVKQTQLETGLAITLPSGTAGGVKLKSPNTKCSALRLFYINREGNERLISDNRCSGIFKVERDVSTQGWVLKWNPRTDNEVWKSLIGMLLKFEIKCVLNDVTMETFVSCTYAKVSGRYDDEKSVAPIDDSWCSRTTVAPPPTVTDKPKTVPATSHNTLASSTFSSFSSVINATSASKPSPSERHTGSMMPIIGGAVGAIVLLLILAVVSFVLVRRREARKGNDYDAGYMRPIIDYRDSTSRNSTDPRYRLDRRLPEKPDVQDDAEYAVIEDTDPINGAEYACADAAFPKVSFRKGPPTYQESTNPYYRPASDTDYKVVPLDGQARDNITYVPSLPSAPPNFYEDPSSTLTSTLPPEYESTLPGSLSDSQQGNPVYEDPNEYEDMTNHGQ